MQFAERLSAVGEVLMMRTASASGNPAPTLAAQVSSSAAMVKQTVTSHLAPQDQEANELPPLRACILRAALDQFNQAADVQVPYLEELVAGGDLLTISLQLSAAGMAHASAALASMCTTHADIYVDEVLGVVALARCQLSKIGQGVADLPDELVKMMRQHDASTAAAEARHQIVHICGPTIKGLPAIFDGISQASQDEEVFDRLVEAPLRHLTSLRDSGSGLSSEFRHAARAVAAVHTHRGTAHPAQLPLDHQEVRRLVQLQLGEAEVQGLLSVLVGLRNVCRGMEPTREHLSLLAYVRGFILAPLAQLQETLLMGHLLPSEVGTQLRELTSPRTSINCTYAKLCGKAGVQDAMVA
ncbi:hypothetical protein ABPG77_008728 [Micractinium sp. CCAP 211/92]